MLIFKRTLFFSPKRREKTARASHTQSQKNRGKKGHKGIGRAYGCQGIRPQKAAYNQRIRHIVALL